MEIQIAYNLYLKNYKNRYLIVFLIVLKMILNI